MFVLAGRYDEAVDYRTAIALAFSYPHHVLFIAKDNHNFSHLDAAGMDAKLLQAFFSGDADSHRLAVALDQAAPYRWMER